MTGPMKRLRVQGLAYTYELAMNRFWGFLAGGKRCRDLGVGSQIRHLKVADFRRIMQMVCEVS